MGLGASLLDWLGMVQRKRPLGCWGGRLDERNPGQGVNRKLPHLRNPGQGVNRQLPHLPTPAKE